MSVPFCPKWSVELIELDTIDRQMIALLRHNAREAIATLAQKLDISRTTARARLKRLLDSGVIEGFTIKGDVNRANLVKAIMLVKIEGTKSESVVRELNRIPEVVDLYSTSGQWDSIVMLETDSLQNFDALLRRIASLTGVKVTETSLMLTSRRTIR